MNPSTRSLHTLVSRQIDTRWAEFSREHPNLAAAIDRIDLTERVVRHVRDDAGYAAALRDADLDEAQLAQAAAALERIDRAVTLLLPR